MITSVLTFLKKFHMLTPMLPDENIRDQDAINASLKGNWKEAIRINNEILDKNEHSLEALNRLGYAYLKLGKLTSAKTTFQKVLALDPYNQIALKNSKLAGVIKKKDMPIDSGATLSPMQFLEDPGKTKIASCVNLAPNEILSFLSPGQEIYLKAKNHAVELRNSENTYLAALPDDISFKLIKLLEAGNTYQVIVKGVNKNSFVVLLRELTRGKRFANQPSFISPGVTSYTPFSKPEGDRPDVSATGEEEDNVTEETTENPNREP